MTEAPTLADAVATAVTAILDGLTQIEVAEVEVRLPEHVRRGKPSKKLIGKSVLDLGWRRMKLKDGTTIYRAPQSQSDPLIAPGEGHNMAADQLRLIIERVENINEDIKGRQDDRKDVFAEAKSNGYDVKTVKEIIRLRGMEKQHRDEAEALLQTYLAALGMA